MLFREAVMAYLLAQPGLTALVASRIHYHQLPQGTILPAVVILSVSDVKHHDLKGQLKVEQPVLQFSAQASTQATARAVAEQLKTALCDYHGTMSGITVQKIQLDSEWESLDVTPDGIVQVETVDLEFGITYVKE
jgi:hypothetical protein